MKSYSISIKVGGLTARYYSGVGSNPRLAVARALGHYDYDSKVAKQNGSVAATTIGRAIAQGQPIQITILGATTIAKGDAA